ncbi:acyltransferase [Paraoerskovia sediminicola]|uniref:acyltransferase n=1 Tax=Paraoerskovia sediminicola TaxID=1138587 RepID=UPI0025731CD0|nr:DapH/DapD/GlmU-related protein [Paraoerskovia sediminicola]
MTRVPDAAGPFDEDGAPVVGAAGASRPRHDHAVADVEVWAWDELATDAQKAEQGARLAALRDRGHVIGQGCVVSSRAAVRAERFELGDRSYVAADAHVGGDVVVGADCSVNVRVTVRGRVRLGRAVRIGAGTSILGFDHTFDDPDTEMFRQPLRSQGITVGDDVWIGAHVVVRDGVTVGSHAVVGAGSVVTRDVPDWAVVVGNPARVVRDRRPGRSGVAGSTATGGPSGSGRRASGRPSRIGVRDLGERARADVPAILDAAWRDGAFHDGPGSAATVRAHCDAVELADLIARAAPSPLSRTEHVALLQGWQDPATGLVPELGSGVRRAAEAAGSVGAAAAVPGRTGTTHGSLPRDDQAYHVLCVGHALDLLGARPAHPVAAIVGAAPGDLLALLDRLPWDSGAWGPVRTSTRSAPRSPGRCSRAVSGPPRQRRSSAGSPRARARAQGCGAPRATDCASPSTAPTGPCAARCTCGGCPSAGRAPSWTPCSDVPPSYDAGHGPPATRSTSSSSCGGPDASTRTTGAARWPTSPRTSSTSPPVRGSRVGASRSLRAWSPRSRAPRCGWRSPGTRPT